MKLQQKIILISFAIVLLFGSLVAVASGANKATDFFMYLGMVGFFAGLIQFFSPLYYFI